MIQPIQDVLGQTLSSSTGSRGTLPNHDQNLIDQYWMIPHDFEIEDR